MPRLALPSHGLFLGGDGTWSGNALLESYRNMPPDLDGQHDRCREQQRSDRDMNYGRDHHGQLGLRGVSPPHDSGDEGKKSEAKLRHHQAKHGDGWAADGIDSGING